MKALHKFSDEYLERCKKLSIEERLEFIENYQRMHNDVSSQTKSISLRIQDPLLIAFKQKAKLEGVAYQTQINKLMKDWVN